jgi:predicted regulator of Ras-like GTPase activity (Roadblock/LC7/MglB family)
MFTSDKGRITILSLILVAIPLFVFPNRLGLGLASGASINLLFELVFYGFVLYFFERSVNLVTLASGAALVLVYRLAIGAVFSVIILLTYGMQSAIAFSLGMTKYYPAVLLHVLAAPFVMRPLYLQLLGEQGKASRRRARASRKGQTGPAAVSRENLGGSISAAAKGDQRSERSGQGPAVVTYVDDDNQFEKSVHYLGESGAVRMALVVDHEGLPLAQFNRSEEDVEVWAPLAVLIESNSGRLLNAYGSVGALDKIDFSTGKYRLILHRVRYVTLMILCETGVDETIHIRIAQAAEMIRKFISEKYSPAMFARVEEQYVSNT